MNQFVRATLIGFIGTCVAGAAGLACSSATSSASDVGRDASAGGDGPSSNAEGGSGGEGGAGDGSTATGTGQGAVLVTQSPTGFHVVASFNPASAATTAGCLVTTVGPCIATACPDVMGVAMASLNAGAITVTGTGPGSPVTLSFGTKGDGGLAGYPAASGQTAFYNAGDPVSASGAGGADLPAFNATLVAPNEIAVTSPACAAGACADVDRSMDATITWSGGGAGRVTVAYVTGTDVGTKLLSCSFDALVGSGTVPSAALMKLDPPGAPNFFGQVLVNPIDSKTIMVGTLPTLFGVQGGTFGGTFTITN